MDTKIKKSKNLEAEKILNIFRFYQKDGALYLSEDTEMLDMLFDAVIHAIDDCGPLKAQLPYNEFVHPSKEVLNLDPGWVGHFKERDNRRFFLSDVHDFLKLFYHIK